MMGYTVSYARLFWEEVKRKAWAAALLGLALFFALPVAMAMVLPSYQPNEYVTLAEVTWRRVKNVRMMLDFGDGNYPMVTIILLVAAVVLGISTFAYLQDKKQVDLYHSLPVKRTCLFLVRIGTGFAIPAAIYLFFILLSLAVAGANGVAPALVLPAAVRGFFLHLLYYALVYSTVVLAMMMTGTRIAAILGTGVFFFYFPMLSGLILSFYEGFFETYSYASPNLWSGIVSKISPLFALFLVLSEGVTAGRLFCALAAAILLLLASLLLYQKRPLEAAGRTMAFQRSKGPIKVLLTIAFGLMGALAFYSLQEDLGWMIFGLLVGTAVSHCVIEIVYHSDFKKLFRHKWTMAVCMVFGLAVCISFYYDVFRYDLYVPEEGQVAYASVDLGQDTWVSYGVTMKEDGYRLDVDREDILDQAQVTDVGPILGLAREGVRQLGLKKEEDRRLRAIGADRLAGAAGEMAVTGQELIAGAEADTSWYAGYDTHAWITICYTLKSGRKVYRSYELWLDPVMEQADQVYTDPAYKDALFPGLRLDVEQAAENAVYREMGGHIQTLQGDLEKWRKVVEAYRDDLTHLSLSARTLEGPVGELLLISDQDEAYILEKAAKKGTDRYGYGWYDGYFYPVYPSFTKTIAALKDCGVTVGSTLDPERFSQVHITAYKGHEEDYGWKKDSAYVPVTVTYEDPEQIRQILAAYSSDDCRRKNGMVLREGQYEVTLVLKERDLSSSSMLSGRFIQGKVPDFVIRDIEEKWKEAEGKEKDLADGF